MRSAEPSLAWRLLWQTVNFKSVNIADIVISEKTMSLLIMELFIYLWCAVILVLKSAEQRCSNVPSGHSQSY